MHVKSIVAGIVYFTSIWIKSGGSNKCYRAKICIHDGKEKCGQDLEGNVRRFLDSCDMKEYNCIQHSNYLKTNSVKCRNLPLYKKPSAYDTVTDLDDNSNKAEQNQDDDNEKGSDESNIDEVEGDKSNLKESQENEDNATNTKDDVDRISTEEGVEEANKKDEVVEVDVVIVSEENTSNLENKEDRATEKDEVDRDTEEEESKENDDDKVHEQNEDDVIDRINNSNESRSYENVGQINGMSNNNSSVSKFIKEHDEVGKSKEDSNDKVDEENIEEGVDGVNESNEPRADDQANGISKIVTCNCTSKLHNEHDEDEDDNRNMNDEENPDKLLAENVYDTDESD